jgi:hypothetical protein
LIVVKLDLRRKCEQIPNVVILGKAIAEDVI